MEECTCFRIGWRSAHAAAIGGVAANTNNLHHQWFACILNPLHLDVISLSTASQHETLTMHSTTWKWRHLPTQAKLKTERRQH
jgi:hypothetical protein